MDNSMGNLTTWIIDVTNIMTGHGCNLIQKVLVSIAISVVVKQSMVSNVPIHTSWIFSP